MVEKNWSSAVQQTNQQVETASVKIVQLFPLLSKVILFIFQEIKAKFEHELVWCIEQPQLGLDTSNPNSKQGNQSLYNLLCL